MKNFDIYNMNGCVFGSVRAHSFAEAAEKFAANYSGSGWKIHDTSTDGYGTKGAAYVYAVFDDYEVTLYTDEACTEEYEGDD